MIFDGAALRLFVGRVFFLDFVFHVPRLLTPYCKTEEIGVPRRAIEECLRTPTVVSMADVFINKAGCIWNEKVREYDQSYELDRLPPTVDYSTN